MFVCVGINVKNAARNAVHARMFPSGVYREGLQRAFRLS